MKNVGLIFPNQLFQKSKLLDNCDEIYVIEHSLFFGEKKYVSFSQK